MPLRFATPEYFLNMNRRFLVLCFVHYARAVQGGISMTANVNRADSVRLRGAISLSGLIRCQHLPIRIQPLTACGLIVPHPATNPSFRVLLSSLCHHLTTCFADSCIRATEARQRRYVVDAAVHPLFVVLPCKIRQNSLAFFKAVVVAFAHMPRVFHSLEQ